MKRYAVMLSGGTGTRMGDSVPKQYQRVKGKMLFEYTLQSVCAVAFEAIVIVAAPEWVDAIRQVLPDGKFLFAAPGENRQLSVWNALQVLKAEAEEDDAVLIQDAARPMTKPELIEACLEKLEQEADADGVVPVLPMKDTVYLSKDGKCLTQTLVRSEVVAGQAPEAFRFGFYYRATEKLLPHEILTINGSAEPAMRARGHICTIAGDESNLKITTPLDLERFIHELE